MEMFTNFLRVNSAPLVNKGAILQYKEDTARLTFIQFVEFPGGMSKFTIRKDPLTHIYITLSNNVTDQTNSNQRNILAFSYSKDLIQWKTFNDPLLHDDTGFTWQDSMKYTGFQYVDWQFDGDDIIYTTRTAYRGASSYRNSNRLIYKVLKNFRSLLTYKL